MSNLTEDDSGSAGAFVKGIDSLKPMEFVVGHATKLAGEFNKLKQQQIDKVKAERRADSDNAKKTQMRMQRALDRARQAREIRKKIRDENEAEKRKEKEDKEQSIQDKIKDGHILDSNYKFRYREIVISLSAKEIKQMFDAGKIEKPILLKMFKYGKSLEKMFQDFPGALVSAIRQKRFHQHPGMIKLLKGSGGRGSASNDGPYKIIHPLFSPKNAGFGAEYINKAELKQTAERLLKDFMSVEPASDKIVGFADEAVVVEFNHMLKMNGAETMLYHCIAWYNSTYFSLKHDKKTITGGEDGAREVEEGHEDWGATEHTRVLEDGYPVKFFTLFSEFFELFRLENMKVYSVLEELIRTHGAVEDDKNIDDEFDQLIGDEDDDRP